MMHRSGKSLDSGLRFGVLGPLLATRQDQPVPLGGRQQRAVLGLLLLRPNNVVATDRLVEELWAGQPPPGARTTLQTYVFHPREALEPGRSRGDGGATLVRRDSGYLLAVDPELIDAVTFEREVRSGMSAVKQGRHDEAAAQLRSALGLWRGAALEDLADYPFVRPEASRLQELRLAALVARVDADLARGESASLVGELRRLTPTNHSASACTSSSCRRSTGQGGRLTRLPHTSTFEGS